MRLSPNCFEADFTKRVKGCGSIWGTGICNELRIANCRYGDGMFDCATCKGKLCNKGDIPHGTTTIYSTPSTYTTTTTTSGATKTTTKAYRG